MKYSEELALRLKGTKSEEIAAMKEQEKLEQEEAAKAQADQAAKEESETKKMLEESLDMIKNLESQLEAKTLELKEAHSKLESANNKKTLMEQPTKSDATDVFKELFNPTK